MSDLRLTDAAITASLRGHLPEQAPPGLRQRVVATATPTPQRRALVWPLSRVTDADPAGRHRAILAAALLLVALVLAGVAVVGNLRRPSLPGGPGAFLAGPSLLQARGGQTATLLSDGRVLLVGGIGELDADLRLAEVWDPAGAAFSPAGSMAADHPGLTATLLADGRVLVIGGSGAELWDPVASTFRPAGSLIEPRSAHTATRLPDGGVLVIGGVSRTEQTSTLGSAELWDPVASTFRPAGSLIEPRSAHTATLLTDGRVLVVGNSDCGAARPEAWDPTTGRFAPLGSTRIDRTSHTVTLLPDGRVLVAGGFDSRANLSALDLIDPETGSVTSAGEMSQPRSMHTATLLADGRVLLVGGLGGSSDRPDAELWDPATMATTPVGFMTEPRYNHTATLLPDGRVLVIGGVSGRKELLSTDIWDPNGAAGETQDRASAAATLRPSPSEPPHATPVQRSVSTGSTCAP